MGPGVRARGQPLARRLCGPYLVPGKAISSETQVQVRTHMPAALRGLHRPPATPLARPSCPEVHTELGCGGWGRPGWQRALHLVLESRPGVGGRRRGCRAPTKPKGGSGRGPQPCGGSSGRPGERAAGTGSEGASAQREGTRGRPVTRSRPTERRGHRAALSCTAAHQNPWAPSRATSSFPFASVL